MIHDTFARILSRPGRSPCAPLPFLGQLALARARVHEFCGPSRHSLALMAGQATEGPLLWIAPGWLGECLMPAGAQPFIAPGRLVFVTPRRTEDLLWCAEEALRSAGAALIVTELPAPPGLTPLRRLQLAAEAGAAAAAQEGRPQPTGLILTPGEDGTPGVESRWHAAPCHKEGVSRWRLTLRRSRHDPPRDWQIDLRPAVSTGPQTTPGWDPAPRLILSHPAPKAGTALPETTLPTTANPKSDARALQT